MPQISTTTTFVVRYTQQEYKAVTQALAVVAGIDKVSPKPEDVEFAAELNRRMLEVQAAELRQRLHQVHGKMAVASQEDEDRQPKSDPTADLLRRQ